MLNMSKELAQQLAQRDADKYGVNLTTEEQTILNNTPFQIKLKFSTPILIRPGILQYGYSLTLDIDDPNRDQPNAIPFYNVTADESPYFLSYAIRPFILEAIAENKIKAAPDFFKKYDPREPLIRVTQPTTEETQCHK